MSQQRTGVVVTAIALVNARNPLDTAWYQRFAGVAEATRAGAEHRGKLDPNIGCLVRLSSQPTERENRARFGVCRNEDGSRCIHAIGLRRFNVALDNRPAIALGKRRKGESVDETVKPIIGIQPVQVRSGQSRSRQAGSECWLRHGNAARSSG